MDENGEHPIKSNPPQDWMDHLNNWNHEDFFRLNVDIDRQTDRQTEGNSASNGGITGLQGFRCERGWETLKTSVIRLVKWRDAIREAGKQAHGVGERGNLPHSAYRGQCDSESRRRRGGRQRERWEADRGMDGFRDRRGREEWSTLHWREGTQSPAHNSPFQCCVGMLLRAQHAGLFPCKHLHASDCARHCYSVCARLFERCTHWHFGSRVYYVPLMCPAESRELLKQH